MPFPDSRIVQPLSRYIDLAKAGFTLSFIASREKLWARGFWEEYKSCRVPPSYTLPEQQKRIDPPKALAIVTVQSAHRSHIVSASITQIGYPVVLC